MHPDGHPLPKRDNVDVALATQLKLEKETTKRLQNEIEALKAAHATELLLKEANVRVELQPKLKEAYDEGVDAANKALENAKSLLRSL